MKGEINVRLLQIRNAMSTAAGTDVGDLFDGDIVFGTVLGNWIKFQHVYRKSSNYAKEVFPGPRYAAIANPLNLNEIYIITTDEADTGTYPPAQTPQPNPAPELPIFEITLGGSDYEIVKAEQAENKVVIQIRPKL